VAIASGAAPEAVPVVPDGTTDGEDDRDGDEDEGDGGDGLAFDAAPARAPLQVECFRDRVRVTWRGRELSSAGSPQSWELLALLLSLPRGRITKETVIDALWPEDAKGADNRLQQVINRAYTILIRQVPDLPRSFIRVGRDGTVRVDTEVLASDVWRVQELCRFAGDKRRPLPPLDDALRALRRAMDLAGVADEPDGIGRPLLGGDGFEWLDRAGGGRSLPKLYEGILRRAIEAVAARCLDEERPDAAAELYELIFDREPGDQAIARRLFRCYGALQDRHGLIQTDRQLRAELKRVYLADAPESELDEIEPEDYEPSPKTVELFRQIEASLPAAPAQLVREASPEPRPPVSTGRSTTAAPQGPTSARR
jgi:DNA-binding SARP family transcriptional activator